MRHVLGILGVLAAMVLLLVSAMMNYQFGYSLGKTPTDSHIYGMASAAADCFKALAPFFFFAAIRNRVWSQALAAALVWLVVTGYAFTSALGHAALNRFTTSGDRVAASDNYKDLRGERKHLEDRLSWIPPHEPPESVKAKIRKAESQRTWLLTNECADATLKSSREFCDRYRDLKSELANGVEAQKLEARIAELGAKIGATRVTGAAVMGEADPQAGVISRLTGLEIGTVQTGLMLFVALLIEIGSGFGMYVAFAFWRPHQSLHGGGAQQPARPTAATQPARKEEETPIASAAGKDEAPSTGKPDPIWSSEPSVSEAGGEAAASGPPAVRFGDNDNKSLQQPAIMPPDDVQRFYHECVDGNVSRSSYVDATKLFGAYDAWCKRNGRRALPMPKFLIEFDKLKVEKHSAAEDDGIGGGVKYFGIALKPGVEGEKERKASRKRRVPQAHEAAGDRQRSTEQSRAGADALAVAAEQLRAAASDMHAAIDQPEMPPGRVKAA